MVSRSRKPRKAQNRPRKRVSTRPRQIPLSKLKKALEALQKQLVILTYGRDCYTCPSKNLQGYNCQLGHVPWPRSIISVKAKFDIRFTRIQCMPCNIHRGGMGAMALERMRSEGIDTGELWIESQTGRGKVVPRSWFEEKIEHYKSLVDNLQNHTTKGVE